MYGKLFPPQNKDKLKDNYEFLSHNSDYFITITSL